MISERVTWDDPKTIFSPAWWLKRLEKKMADRDAALAQCGDYYDGKHNLLYGTEKFTQTFGRIFANFSNNWCGLVVDSVEERLTVQGFRIPQVDPGGIRKFVRSMFGREKPTYDEDAWDYWQRNGMDEFSQIAHIEALINRECTALVWWGDDGRPQITVEHPRTFITEMDPENPRKYRAGLKKWMDDSGYVFANLYLPEYIFKFRSDRPAKDDYGSLARAAKWVERETPDEEWPLTNKLNEVPATTLPNRPRLLAPSESEIIQVIPAQDAVNKLCVDMLLASESQAFRQRFIAGIQLPRDPETNEVIMPYKQILEKVWIFEGERPVVGELGQVDLSGHVRAIELFVQHIASRTRTPPHYFFLKGQFPSGESIKAAETGLVAKTLRKEVPFGGAWERVQYLCLRVDGKDDKAEASLAGETIWADAESRSESEHVDALVKLSALGVPEEQLWADAGYSPQQIEDFKAKRAEESKVVSRTRLSGVQSPSAPPVALAGSEQ